MSPVEKAFFSVMGAVALVASCVLVDRSEKAYVANRAAYEIRMRCEFIRHRFPIEYPRHEECL